MRDTKQITKNEMVEALNEIVEQLKDELLQQEKETLSKILPGYLVGKFKDLQEQQANSLLQMQQATAEAFVEQNIRSFAQLNQAMDEAVSKYEERIKELAQENEKLQQSLDECAEDVASAFVGNGQLFDTVQCLEKEIKILKEFSAERERAEIEIENMRNRLKAFENKAKPSLSRDSSTTKK
ncbi:hypothetical protein [Terasakiella pusilla]|uniref:hypothetical protein n=1 Tax=Terasakiella pusilla TaxID=64973 RepID=UPI003AA8F4DB